MRLFKAISLTVIFLCTYVLSSAQNCILTCPANIVTKADAGKEGAIVNFPPLTLAAECGTVTYSTPSGSFFRLGSHSIIITTSTAQKCSFTVTVTDNEPPFLSPLTLSRSSIWPASNKMKKVGVYYNTSDNGEKVNTTITVSSNAMDGIKDWEIVDEHLVRLKSSRLPDGTVRVYSVSVIATDEAGNKTTRTTSIAVSKTMVAKAAK